jgi:hypothetical protein
MEIIFSEAASSNPGTVNFNAILLSLTADFVRSALQLQ